MSMLDTMFDASRTTPWDGLGKDIKAAYNSEQAINLAGLNWEVVQKPVVNVVHHDDGSIEEVPSTFWMNTRNTDNSVLGVVGGRYKLVQNTEAFDFLDTLLGEGLTYETAGSLNNGRRVWLLAKMPEKDILGDIVEPFMCLTNSHDGFGSLKVCMTPVRVVCQNTLNLALHTAKRMWNARHTGDITGKIAVAKQTLGLAQTYMDNLSIEAEELAQIKVAPKDFEFLSSTLFPITEEMSGRKEEAQFLLQSQLRHAWEMDDLGNIKGTGWGFMNAVSDMATHRPPSRKTENYKENAFITTIDAPTILDNAMKIIKELKTA